MNLLNNYFLMIVDLFVRCFIIVWLMYLTAINTNLFENGFIQFIVGIMFLVWVIIFPVIKFLENR